MGYDILWIAAGLVALLVGGESLVRGAVALALRAGLSPMVIGLTLVGFGTSTPELLTSIQAALAGAPGIAIGNVVGSNIANVLLILGIAAIIAPIAVKRAELRRDGAALLLATAVGSGLMLTGHLGAIEGLVLLAGLAAFLFVALRAPAPAAPDVPEAPGDGPLRAALLFAGGLALTLLGARWLVDGAIGIAEALSVPQTVIGLTIVAVGTSLPELVTSAIAARRGQGDIAFGNVIGSNVFNILGILGATALVQPIPVPPQVLVFDLWAMAAAALLLVWVAASGWRISRREGWVLLGLYAAYLAAQSAFV